MNRFDQEINIVLVGFMGTGKSAVGKQLAATLHYRLVDMDEIIAARAGKPIARIFSDDGEPRFRAMERDLVRELAQQQSLVIAAGGGIVLNPDNIRDFSQSGLVVCLSAAPEEILRRVGNSTHRPLLNQPDPVPRFAICWPNASRSTPRFLSRWRRRVRRSRKWRSGSCKRSEIRKRDKGAYYF